MIRLYSADINSIKKADYISEYNLLSNFNKGKIDSLKLNDDKRRSLAARILLRKGIRELFGIENYSVSYTEHGKPTLPFCFFSLSHSGSMAVCAISDTEIGVDVQSLKARLPALPLRLFSERENAYISSARDTAAAFFEVWTKKEAYIKLSGGVLAHGLKADIFSLESIEFRLRISGEYIITTAQAASGINSDILG